MTKRKAAIHTRRLNWKQSKESHWMNCFHSNDFHLSKLNSFQCEHCCLSYPQEHSYSYYCCWECGKCSILLIISLHIGTKAFKSSNSEQFLFFCWNFDVIAVYSYPCHGKYHIRIHWVARTDTILMRINGRIWGIWPRQLLLVGKVPSWIKKNVKGNKLKGLEPWIITKIYYVDENTAQQKA